MRVDGFGVDGSSLSDGFPSGFWVEGFGLPAGFRAGFGLKMALVCQASFLSGLVLTVLVPDLVCQSPFLLSSVQDRNLQSCFVIG